MSGRLRATRSGDSLDDVCRRLARHPAQTFIRGWNWKSAVTSSTVRAAIFLLANLSAGPVAALRAMGTEFALRAVTAGFYGALTESFRRVEPRRHAMLAAVILLPLVAHSLELLVHWASGTPRLARSIGLSASLTVVSTAFNLFAMQRGAFIVGDGRAGLIDDLRRVPRLVAEFLSLAARTVRRWRRRRIAPARRGLAPRRA